MTQIVSSCIILLLNLKKFVCDFLNSSPHHLDFSKFLIVPSPKGRTCNNRENFALASHRPTLEFFRMHIRTDVLSPLVLHVQLLYIVSRCWMIRTFVDDSVPVTTRARRASSRSSARCRWDSTKVGTRSSSTCLTSRAVLTAPTMSRHCASRYANTDTVGALGSIKNPRGGSVTNYLPSHMIWGRYADYYIATNPVFKLPKQNSSCHIG